MATRLRTPKKSLVIEAVDTRVALDADSLEKAIRDHLLLQQARFPEVATANDWYLATAWAVRDRLLHRWIHAARTYLKRASRTVCYFSAEFLLGPHLGNNIFNMGIEPEVREALGRLGQDLDTLVDVEEEPGLGNGGLGRLAACYMEALATCDIPAIGYGIRYEFGIFDQQIHDGHQIEVADTWLRLGYPWEIARPEISFEVGFGGHTEHTVDSGGKLRVRWIPAQLVRGVAYDTPVLGYRTNTASLLRLWRAEGRNAFDLESFNEGDYVGAVHEAIQSENITKVLYPKDDSAEGKRLRLQQQAFFASCSLRDMLRIYRQRPDGIERLADKYVVQLNDTHPAIAVAELMRLLVDVEEMEWDAAWEIARRVFAYTNHTLLPEALERWSAPLFSALLPRHWEIVCEINRRFCDELRERFPGDEELVRRVSIVGGDGEQEVRMAHLACVGSHRINGVAELHSELLRTTVLPDFDRIWPDRFCNVTNGVTPRRFVALANPALRAILDDLCGVEWVKSPKRLRALEGLVDDEELHERWRSAKRAARERLAGVILARTGIEADAGSLFDVQVKRIHEYKRQHLNLLRVIWDWMRIRRDPSAAMASRTVIFGGKAAPGYRTAKLIIRLIHGVADVVNSDPDVAGRLKVVFVPDFNVKLAQWVYPAADLSEQISTAGKEASGTGNMKFGFNGALTIGTLDGANVEIRREVGPENFFLFGLDADSVVRTRLAGYSPGGLLAADPELAAVVETLRDGTFSRGNADLFAPIVESLVGRDEYLVLADFRAYVQAQAAVDRAWRDPRAWTRMSILNTARMGYFSADRSIRDYAQRVWNVSAEQIDVPG